MQPAPAVSAGAGLDACGLAWPPSRLPAESCGNASGAKQITIPGPRFCSLAWTVSLPKFLEHCSLGYLPSVFLHTTDTALHDGS